MARPVTDRKPDDKRRAAPLLLLPMRLEYRRMQRGKTYRIATPPRGIEKVAEIHRRIAETAEKDPGALLDMRERLAATLDEIGAGTPAFDTLEIPGDQLWLRWYPDDNFAETGHGPASKEEQRLLDELTALREFDHLPNPKIPEQIVAFEALAAVAGPARALHLLRTDGDTNRQGWETRIGRIAGLPDQVQIYAVNDAKPVLIGAGAPIPPNPASAAGPVSLAPGSVDTLTWLSSFDMAVAEGMGMKLTDPAAVEAAMAADWLVALGISGGDGPGDITALIADGVATGGFGFLPDNAATNNAPGAPLSLLPERDNAAEFLASARAVEDGAFQAEDLPADRLATALGLDPAPMRKAPFADHPAAQDAAAMIQVIGPALLDGALRSSSLFDGMGESSVIRAMADILAPSGPLSALRFGDNAYGLLPLAAPDAIKIESEARAAMASLGAGYAQLLERSLADQAEAVSLRIEPDDPDAGEKLGLILAADRGSRRLDVSESGASDANPVACPYVEGPDGDDQPDTYLRNLLDKPLADLPDPADGNRTSPLLYRLARLSLANLRILDFGRLENVLPLRAALRDIEGIPRDSFPADLRKAFDQVTRTPVAALTEDHTTLDAVNIDTRAVLTGTNAWFDAALRRLLGLYGTEDGAARLEGLMMDVIDTFQYRLDIWLTAHAWLRLQADRDGAALPGLRIGHYGFLRGPGTEAETTRQGGYLQAPSPPQAVAAAILRSAYLRNADGGAFAVNLRSHWVRRALALLDRLGKGVGLPQALGLRAEAWLRREGEQRHLGKLRDDYPLADANSRGRDRVAKTLDGLAFSQAARPASPEPLGRLHDALNRDLDTLADLVMAEAVYQRSTGAADLANAWLQVLSGGAVPGRPEFLRTERLGQSSDHRVTLLLPDMPPPPGKRTPRGIVEPGAATLLAEAEAQWDDLTIAVTAQLAGSGETVLDKTFRLQRHLRIQPIDLAMTEPARLLRRIKTHAIAALLAETGLVAPLLDINPGLATGDISALPLVWQITLDGAPLDSSARSAQLSGFASMLRNANPLAPGDLNAAASPEAPLDAASEAAALRPAVTDMGRRLSTLETELAKDLKQLKTARTKAYEQITRIYVLPGRPWGQEAPLDRETAKLFAGLAERAARMANWGDRVAAFALLPPAVIAGFEAAEAAVTGLESRLAARLRTLSAYRAARPPLPADADRDALRARLDADIAALRAALGDEAYPVIPRLGRIPATDPLVSAPQSVTDGLGDWPRYRRKLAQATSLVATLPDYLSHPVSIAATADDADDPGADDRPETEAPRSYHRGRFLAPPDRMALTSFAGLVLDEWVEKRPSRIENSALAINHDAPQAEAPNCLLLCTADDPKLRPGWTGETAAARVAQAIDRMRIRAFTTRNTALVDTIIPNANQVAYRQRGTRERARIPEVTLKLDKLSWHQQRAQFAALGLDAADPGRFGDRWPRVTRLGKPRRAP